jgi:uncharacterized protein (DUF1330 family)
LIKEEVSMSVYLIIEYTDITDEAAYFDYIKKAEPMVEKFSGEYIVRTNKVTPLSGDWKPERIVIIKFPSEDTMKKCFGSDEYRSLSSLRVQSTSSRAILVEEYVESYGY